VLLISAVLFLPAGVVGAARGLGARIRARTALSRREARGVHEDAAREGGEAVPSKHGSFS
jgi:hypothetical protein